jgi:putative nucleotidyltransferase with HDIG domain
METSVLIVSDRPDRSGDLTAMLARLCACQTIGLDDNDDDARSFVAIVTDVVLQDPSKVVRLRELLSRHRTPDTQVVAVARKMSRLVEVQAMAAGATSVLDLTSVAMPDALGLALGLIKPPAGSDPISPTKAGAKKAQAVFATMFHAAASGRRVSIMDIENGTKSIMSTVREGGIRKWLEVVWTLDDVTFQHCLLVTGLAAAFAASLKFARDDRILLTKGALLHDIGKARIPLKILNKPDSLSAEETKIMRAHTIIGHDLLAQQGDCEPQLLEVILRHHELLDGSGYPSGLAGGAISDLVRLVTICDIYAALIERRSYKEPILPIEALKIIRSMDGKLEGVLLGAFAQVAEQAAIES